MLLATGGTPKLIEVKETVGLLPFRLGIAYNSKTHFELIIKIELGQLLKVYEVYIKELKGNRNYENLQLQIENKLEALNVNVNERRKRGAFNFLGNIVKVVTGNLDSSDGERYENLIKQLENNQNIIKGTLIQNIKLMNKTFNEFDRNILQLADTQKHIIETLNDVQEQNINQHLINELNVINEQLSDLINIISLAKSDILHQGLIKPKQLINEIKTIHLDNFHKFPFEPLIQNNYLIQSLIKIRSYQIRNVYVFILQIPIIENLEYQYYQLYSLPVYVNGTFVEIIPESTYLAVSQKDYIQSDQLCQSLHKNEYLCKNKVTGYFDNIHEPCELNLIMNNVAKNCLYYETIIENFEIRESPDLTIIVLTVRDKIVESCNKIVKSFSIKGTYVIYNENTCTYNFNGITIQNYNHELNDNNLEFIKGQSFKQNITLVPHSDIKINNIDNELKEQIETLNNVKSVYSTNHVVIYVLLIVAILLIVIFVTFKIIRRKMKISRTKSNPKEGGVMSLQDL